MLKKWFKILLSVFFLFSLEGCLVRVCNVSFDVDNGKNSRYRYSMPEEIDYAIGIDVKDNDIDVSVFTSSNKSFVKDRGVKLKVKDMFFLLKNTNDTLYLLDIQEGLYTCSNFKERIKENNELYLKFEYTIDSMGVIKDYSKEYNLVKRKNCHFMFRVH